MKLHKLILCGLIAIMAATGCKKLDLAPEDYFGSGNFWKSAEQVRGAMTGLHADLRGTQFTTFTLGELRGGNFKEGTGGTGTSSLNSAGIIRQDIRESSPGISSWGGYYSKILQVNNFIYRVGNAGFLADADKNYYLGQAYGLRAYYYFILYRTFGRVPLATVPQVVTDMPKSSDQAYMPRAKTEKEVLDFIKSDIDKSVTSFGTSTEMRGQGSQWSVYASLMLKAEVYLWSAKVKTDGAAPAATAEDLSTARAALEKVIPVFTLQSNFADVFKYANKGNKEIIFALRYAVGEATNNFSQFLYQVTDPMTSFTDAAGNALPSDPLQVSGGGSFLRYEYKYDMFTAYSAGDTRAKATFFDFYKKPIASNRFIVLSKFMGTVDNGNRSFSDDYPIYRLADAYLLLAEVKNKQGQDPSAEINTIRKRAYGIAAYTPYTNGSFEANELAIFQERSKELVAEGRRWWDLRRMQDASGSPLAFRTDLPMLGVLKATEAYKLLWPIDRSTLTNDETLKNDQNPSYSGT